MVNGIAAMLEFCRDPPVTIARKFQGDLLNLVLQSHIFAIHKWGYSRLLPPFVVAAATHFEYLAGWGYWQLKAA
jgi:hypothetical protein